MKDDTRPALREAMRKAMQSGLSYEDAAGKVCRDFRLGDKTAPAPAPFSKSSKGGIDLKDQSTRPGPWYRWISDRSMWAWVRPTDEELEALESGQHIAFEMTLDEARARWAVDGDEAA